MDKRSEHFEHNYVAVRQAVQKLEPDFRKRPLAFRGQTKAFGELRLDTDSGSVGSTTWPWPVCAIRNFVKL